MKVKSLAFMALACLFTFSACKKDDEVCPNASSVNVKPEKYFVSGKLGEEKIDIEVGVNNYEVGNSINSGNLQFKSNCFIRRSTYFRSPHPTRNFPTMHIEIDHAYPSEPLKECKPSFEEFQTIVKNTTNKFSGGIFMTKDVNTYQGGHFVYQDLNGKIWQSGPGYFQNGSFTIEEIKLGSKEKEEVIITFKIKCELFNHTDSKLLELSGKCPLSNIVR